MQDEHDSPRIELVELTAEVVSAYIARNHVAAGDIPALIASVHTTLNSLRQGATTSAAAEKVEKPAPAQVRKSITPDALISFIDGKPYKTLKRHLSTHGLDPYSYRQRYGLPNDYPMVAANYAAQRSELAKAIGLGRPGAMAEADQASGGRRKTG
ncbi:MucR family transcriptional regulator [Methylobacterium oxalidis]|uniref:MucR family transcriptional regulator n=1 Tax=Methylobacterium oxalidis TaxID=944322 RepID=A0A512J6P1_9HYPH|nr:MucR family transcriptional regulator [Methylobacterium oxalidis]GEP05626.1 hypothetical protein MOX02_36640 [Methylobacterium oxalidis]GJE35485.1 Transcriptional regulatory protein ros [Methylobacterium oxalidis]GLS65394.1 hypothetical protein GCM10007888_37760 [Methylobacterium oxalidis]